MARIRTVVVEDQVDGARAAGRDAGRRARHRCRGQMRHRQRSGRRPFAATFRTWCCWTCRCPISTASKSSPQLGDAMPLTIFVTAYDEYALKAFEVHAFDYLLKPFGRERFHQAVARARTRLTEGLEEHLARRFVSLVHDAGSAPAASGRLMVKSGGADDAPAARRARCGGVRRQLRAAATRAAVRISCATRWPASRRVLAAIASAAFIAAGSSISIACGKSRRARTANTNWCCGTEGRLRVGRAYREVVYARLKGDGTQH